jgi:hypothetical protein
MASGAITAHDVFQVWARRPDVWEAFHGNLRQLAEYARQESPETPVYIPRLLTEHRSFVFQTLGLRNVRPYEDWPTLLGPAPAAGGRRLIVVTAMDGLMAPLQQLLPQASVVQNFRTPTGNTWAAVLAVPEDALPPPPALRELQRAWRGPMNF